MFKGGKYTLFFEIRDSYAFYTNFSMFYVYIVLQKFASLTQLRSFKNKIASAQEKKKRDGNLKMQRNLKTKKDYSIVFNY